MVQNIATSFFDIEERVSVDVSRSDSQPSLNSEPSVVSQTTHTSHSARTVDTEDERTQKVMEAIKKYHEAMKQRTDSVD